MLEQLGGSPQDDDATETSEGSPDPTRHVATAGGRFEHHPLFPRADGSAETRDIKFVSFCRMRASDQATLTYPEDIPARGVKTWAQVVEWWGGGEYKAVGKDAKHRTVAWFPSATGEWLTLDGDSKPFVLRNREGGATPAPAAAQLSAPALAPQDALLGMKTQVLHELRNIRVAAAPPPPASDGPLMARIQAQAAQATAASQMHAAEATATRQANTQIMQTLLSVVAERPVESAMRPAESTMLALQLISAIKKLVPTPAVAPCIAEQIPVIKALSDLDPSAAVAPAIELQPVVDIFDQVMTADAARTQPERVQTATEPQEAPTPHRPPRPRPALVHVPGLGMVEVVAADADALLLDDMSTEERAAAIRKDPALLRELGIALAPVAVAQPSPAAPARPMSSAVVEPVRCPRSRADAGPCGRSRAVPVVGDGARCALRCRRNAARARDDRPHVARDAVDGHRCARGASGDRARGADARHGTAARGSALPSAGGRRAEAADLAHARGAGRRAPKAARHRSHVR